MGAEKHVPGTPRKSRDQSEEGMGLGSWISISFPQHWGWPGPAFVQRISVPQTEQRYLLPSWLIFLLLG